MNRFFLSSDMNATVVSMMISFHNKILLYPLLPPTNASVSSITVRCNWASLGSTKASNARVSSQVAALPPGPHVPCVIIIIIIISETTTTVVPR
jgi:hypothetical protein